MANQLFNELVKLASEKAGRYGGWGGYGRGGGYGGGRHGGGAMEYYGRGGMMRMNPEIRNQMIRERQLRMAGEGADMPNLGVGAERAHGEYKELQDRKPTQFTSTVADQQSKETQKRLERAHADLATHNTAYTTAEGNITGLENQLKDSKKKWLEYKRKYETAGNLSKGWGELMPYQTDTYANKQLALQHGSEYEALQQTLGPQIARSKALMADADAQRKRHTAIIDQGDTTRQQRENAAWGSTADIDKNREEQYRGTVKARQEAELNRVNQAAGAGAQFTGQKPPAVVQQGPAAGAPGGPAPAPAPPVAAPPVKVPQLPKPPGNVHPIAQKPAAAVTFLPAILDQLVEGAARNMFDRYVKVASAKLAAEASRNRPISSLPGLPPHAKPHSPKHVPFSTGTLKGKSQKKANSMYDPAMGLDPAVAAALAGRGKFHLSDSSVNLGPDVAGVGSGAAPTPQGMNTTAPATINRSGARKAQEAAKVLKAQQGIADTQAREQMKFLRQAQQVHHGAIQAEQKAFMAKHGPAAGAGSAFFRSKATVPGLG